jgi:flagellin FlaB
MKRDNAFTGLEAAIVLIAFVVVAAIFSYVLLGAGFFATQKAQEVTYAGIKQSVSNAVIDGSMYANVTGDKLDGLMFNVRVPLGGEAIDMSTTTFIFASSEHPTPQILKNLRNASHTNRDSGFVYPIKSANLVYSGPGPIVGKPAVEMVNGVAVQVSSVTADYAIMGYYPTPTTSVLTSGEFATFLLNIGTDESLDAKQWFTLEMRPRIGAATLISKTLGSGVKGGEIL